MKDECCNQGSSPSLLRCSHSEVRSRAGGGQVVAEDLTRFSDLALTALKWRRAEDFL